MSRLSELVRISQQLSIAAKEEASRWGHPQIDVEHLLLGMLLLESRSGSLLRGLGLTVDGVRDAVQALHRERLAALGIEVEITAARPADHPAVGSTVFSDRAMKVLRGGGDELAVLDALTAESSGTIATVLRTAASSVEEVQAALATARSLPREPERSGSLRQEPELDSHWITVTEAGFVPAPVERVWDLVADPLRRPTWDHLVGRVELVAPHTWDLWAATSRPDGGRARVSRRYARQRLQQVRVDQPCEVSWDRTLPDLDRPVRQRVTIALEAVEGGTRVQMSLRWARRGGVTRIWQRVLTPWHRWTAQQMLWHQAAGISRVLR